MRIRLLIKGPLIPRAETGLHRRHCEEPWGQVGGATKQSPDTISYIIFAKIALRDCFVTPRSTLRGSSQ